MNAIRNKVQLIGHLGDAPEITAIDEGRLKAVLSVATTETYRNVKSEKVTETQTHRVVTWGKIAEIAEKYLAKGTEVAIEGKLINSHYTDGKGVIRHITEVHASELLILTKKG